MKLCHLLLALFAGLSSGCVTTTVVGGKTLGSQRWNEDSEAIRTRAAFDLHCAADQLALTILAINRRGGWTPIATQVGVSGCGNQAVYVLSPSGWVVNSTDKQQ